MAAHIIIPASHLCNVTLVVIAMLYLGPLIGSFEVELETSFNGTATSIRGFSVAYETPQHAR